MIKQNPAMATTAAVLRREFDRSFAEEPTTEIARRENFLAVRIGGDAYALRVAEIGGLYVDRTVVPLPTPLPSLLGMAGFRGQIAPVYDLAALLGYSVHAAPRWLVLVRLHETVALAFDTFEAQLVVLAERVIESTAAGNGGETRPHVHGAVHIDTTVRPIVHLASVLADIQKRVQITHQLTQSVEER